ncbi:5,10-methylene-tetrahydrofolate cyclohydrolase [Porphyromonas sp. COT-108 OH2963]|uniref:bifunctional methylenetetrahydrofolate dehydrogenase/methenyltetrahydrofolate cyclohydrolase FolD n=1 Tax=Porphyromonas sp. COT-108 OH2963 TaxID=1515614 RepID=UPI00052C2D89|nr:bifunctional methylenetetrahydrofolate dehydrogenase/methenyltetrahydrofolate cyclohydrolase FolD [Porphyromonas sp. COT-108 OH2963]KGN96559.1 5,10-methylene-tetrahydrofolate cyclohydrolase [Porphyromonas sp. COT-108 OH2963]
MESTNLDTNKYQILSGKEASTHFKDEIRKEVEAFVTQGERAPHLAAILVGHDGGSETYVASKMKTCEEVGFKSSLIRYEEDITEEELLKAIQSLNEDDELDGFIVQMPLPKHIDEQKVIEAVDPRKDVDGFHPENVGKMSIGLETFVSATPLGIISLLKYYNISTRGKHCVVVGRSNIVGKPMANLLLYKGEQGDATVTICHSRTPNIAEITRQADILIAAVGIPEYIKGDMVKDGVIVIDVGTTRVPDSSKKSGFRLSGDVKFNEVAPKASYITPVPGGVGPMTICSLMQNTLKAAKQRKK